MFRKKNKIIVKISGMHCMHCAKKVEDTLIKIENVLKVKVDLNKNQATLFVNGPVSNAEIKELIEGLDYKVEEVEEL